jgi:hypothetical protein
MKSLDKEKINRYTQVKLKKMPENKLQEKLKIQI